MRKSVTSFVILAVLAIALAVTPCVAQSQQAPSAFPTTTYNFNLSPITLPGVKASATGAESDVKMSLTPNFAAGETTLTSADYVFAGGRFDYVIPQFSKWLQNVSPTLNGYQFQLGATGSLGVVKPFGTSSSSGHWGERAGFFLNYAVSGTTGLGLEVQMNNFVGYQRWAPSIAFGPNFHF